MSERDDGGLAFPRPLDPYPNTGGISRPGMSLRDWFAGQALAILADPNSYSQPENIAKAVYEIADAMLAERKR